MKKRIYIINLLLMLFVFLSFQCSKNSTSEFNGIWVGKMIQPKGPMGTEGYNQYFQFVVTGTTVKGKSRIEISDSSYFGEMTLSGHIKNDSLFFNEDSILSQIARENHWWCIKQGFLVIDSSKTNMYGEWYSSNCTPGIFKLHRIF
jgi:hypothetical protein